MFAEFIGIDPGITGAVGIIHDDGTVEVYDAPVILASKGKKTKHEYSLAGMAKILGPYAGRDNVIVGLESVHALPGEAANGAFSFGRGLGLWEGILAAYRIRYERIAPQRWKKMMMSDMGKEKGSSRVRAQQLFPKVDLTLKKHHGRGDALLLAEYCRRTYCGLNGNKGEI